ncbi:MAG: G8 domain-containing protein, partial [Candidatus Binatia bacterium]
MSIGPRTIDRVIGALFLLLAAIGQAAAANCHVFSCVSHYDVIPNFAAQPTIRSIQTGAWSSASTWNLARLPNATDVVAIGSGTSVIYDAAAGSAKILGIEANGRLTFRTDVSTRLSVGTLLVLPQGALQIGTALAPIGANVTAEIVIANQPLDTSNDGIGVYDPRQYGTGILAVDGQVSLHGAAKTTYQRLALEPRAGDVTLRLAAAATGWRAGDRIFLPDSKHYAIESVPYVFEGEEATVASVSADGLTVNLTSALRFNHPGARDGNDVLEFLPHVGNLSRSIVIRSENPAGTRGHILLTGRSDIDIRYAALRNLGRTTVDPLDNTTFDAQGQVTHVGTNHIGRYPLHIHHLIGPSNPPANTYQYTVLGNAVDDDAATNRRKWAITVHDSHYGLINNNVVYNAGGWGIGTEDGGESFNEFSANFVAKVRGEGGRANSEGGLGFWLRGPNNILRDNVVANVMGTGVEGARGYEFFFVYLGDICVPNFKGADPALGQCTMMNGNALPLLEFARNEVYGPTEIGLSIWWLGTLDTDPLPVAESIVRDFRVWHHSRYGYYGYPANRLTFDGFVARGNKNVIANQHEFILGIWFGDYMNQDVVIRRADIQNLRTGIVPPYFMRGTTLIEDSYLRNATNIAVVTIGAPGSAPYGPNMPPKENIIRNVGFGTVNGSVGGQTQYAIAMDYDLHNGSANLIERDAVFVYDYNRVAGDNFQVFYNEQRPDFIVPQSSGNLAGSPAAGLTNTQNWSTYGIAIANEVANNTTTRAGTYGLVRGGTPPPPPPPATAPSITTQPASRTVSVGQTATFNVVASGTAPLSYQWQKSGANIAGATAASYTT